MKPFTRGERMGAGEYDSRLESSNGETVLRVRGDLDLYAAPALKLDFTAAIEDSTGSFVIDLTDVGFLDSTGLGVLVGALRRLKETGRSLVLIAAAPSVLKVFSVTGLDHVFTIRTAAATPSPMSGRETSGRP